METPSSVGPPQQRHFYELARVVGSFLGPSSYHFDFFDSVGSVLTVIQQPQQCRPLLERKNRVTRIQQVCMLYVVDPRDRCWILYLSTSSSQRPLGDGPVPSVSQQMLTPDSSPLAARKWALHEGDTTPTKR
jgi:hypothetical protein